MSQHYLCFHSLRGLLHTRSVILQKISSEFEQSFSRSTLRKPIFLAIPTMRSNVVLLRLKLFDNTFRKAFKCILIQTML